MYCCSNCFNDEFLKNVIEHKSNRIGKCNFCKTQNIHMIEPKKLKDFFQALFDLYVSVETEGNTIPYLFKKDWILFISLDDKNTIQLLESILEIKLKESYLPKKNGLESNIIDWQDFREELKHINRYFPKKAPSYDHLEALLDFIVLASDKVPKLLYRSRVNVDTKVINIDKMGKPPAKISQAGRANPIGIPYLYTASDIDTAIAEIRPHKGDDVTIATFEVKEKLLLADLRNPRQSISPFELTEDGLNQIYIDLDYLCHLGEELKKPILPREAHLEYLSSQYLCELIKDCGFDGVVYKSSVGSGDNYAIFNDEKLAAKNIETYHVKDIEISSSRIVGD